jgi:hypothetical protein
MTRPAKLLAGRAVTRTGRPAGMFQCSRHFRAWTPDMCLPYLFGVQSEQDTPPAPYSVSRGGFRRLEGSFKVGIRWSGHPQDMLDLMRSTHLSDWRAVLDVPSVTFYSFQFPAAAVQLRDAGRASVVDLVPELTDWRKTAVAVAQMDLVIATDSSLAYLAGALGRPVWIALGASADWRWGLEGPSTPWYASARLFRQRSVGEWEALFEELAIALEQMVHQRGQRSA